MPATVPLAFIDCETTSLNRLTRRPWEIAVIRREPDGTEKAASWFVDDIDLTDADPASLKFGRFYERYQFGWPAPYSRAGEYFAEETSARRLERLTRGAHLVGMVPSFDEETFAAMLRRHRLAPSWHYHLVNVEDLVAGFLGLEPPQKSEDLSRALGVDPATFDRHTALGDARWAMALYDVVMSARRPVAS